jgi:hypothetical protein
MSFSTDKTLKNIANFRTAQLPAYEDRLLFRFLLFLPVLNAAADSTIYYFVDINSKGIHPGLVRGVILLLFIFLFGFKRILRYFPNYLIIVFLFYLFLLSIISSNVTHSLFDGYMKWFVAMMMFPVGYYFLREYNSILKYNLLLVFGAFIVCINLLVAQIIGYGISAYVKESFYTGGAGVGITNQLALILLTYPVLLRNLKKFKIYTRWFIVFTGILSFSFLILAMKRAGIIGLIGGGLMFLLITQSRARIVRYLIVGAIIVLVTLPIYKDILLKRYEARVETIDKYDKEARYLEVFYVIDEFKSGNLWQKLFGTEAFNTGEYFGMKYFNRGRMIHGDFSALVYGTGLTGIAMYLSIFFILLRKGFLKFRKIHQHKLPRELLAVFFGLLFATFLISATGSGTVGERCIVYTYFGAVLGYLNRLNLDKKLLNNIDGSNTDLQ